MFIIVKCQLLWKCLNFSNLWLVDMRDKKEAIKFQTTETGTLLSTQLQVKRSKQADLCCVLCNNGGWNESWRRRKKVVSLIQAFGKSVWCKYWLSEFKWYSIQWKLTRHQLKHKWTIRNIQYGYLSIGLTNYVDLNCKIRKRTCDPTV
jgi:hypothetical protein